MAKKKVKLYWRDLHLATLQQKGSHYLYRIDYKNVKKACRDGCHTSVIGHEDGVLDQLPPIFCEFEISRQRTDLKEKYGLEKGDSRFDILYKQALKNSFSVTTEFWLHADQ